MAACKDCICYEILCRDTLQGDELKPCKDFKNKADFVEVVRCKDCKHSREQDRVFGITDYKCSKHNISCLSPYDFCSYGVRSDTE